MAVSLSIDLTDATFSDLEALVDAARTAGVTADVELVLEDTTLIVTVDETADRPVAPETVEDPRPQSGDVRPPRPSFSSPGWGGQAGPIGDAAIRSVIDILTGRQEPPRRND